MDAVILMVSCATESGIFDLEVMPDVPASELAAAVANALHWPGIYDIEVATSGQRLAPHQTLADAGVWDGSLIRLVKTVYTPTPGPSHAPSNPFAAPTPPANRPLSAPAVVTGANASPVPVRNPAANWNPITPDPKPQPSSPVVGWQQPDDKKTK